MCKQRHLCLSLRETETHNQACKDQRTRAHIHKYTNSSENTQTCLNTGSNCAYTPALCTDNGYIQLKHTW